MAKVGVRIEGTETLSKASGTASKSLKQLKADTGDLKKSAQDLVGPLNNIKGALGALGIGFVGAQSVGRILKELRNEIDASVRAFYDFEQANAKLNSVLLATGKAASMPISFFDDLAQQYLKTTVYGDEVVKNAAAIGLTFDNISRESLPRVLAVAADMATVFGTDLVGAMQQLGVALEDPEAGMTRLRRSGVVLDESTKTLVKSLVEQGKTVESQNILLSALEGKVKGAAEMMGDTAWGASEKLKNSLDELREAVGARMAPALKTFNEGMAEGVRLMTDMVTQGQRFKDLGLIMPGVDVKALEKAYTALSPGGGVAAWIAGGKAPAAAPKAFGGQAVPSPATIIGWDVFKAQMDAASTSLMGMTQEEEEAGRQAAVTAMMLENLTSRFSTTDTAVWGLSEEAEEAGRRLALLGNTGEEVDRKAAELAATFSTADTAIWGLSEEAEEAARRLALLGNTGPGLTVYGFMPVIADATSAIMGMTEEMEEAGRQAAVERMLLENLISSFSTADTAIMGLSEEAEDAARRLALLGSTGAYPTPAGGWQALVTGGEETPGGPAPGGTGWTPGWAELHQDELAGLGDALQTATLGMLGFTGQVVQSVIAMGPFGLILEMLKPVLAGFFNIIGPALNEVLAPLIGHFVVVGQILGQLLIPIFQALAPIIAIFENLFVGVMNILRPLFNLFGRALSFLVPIIDAVSRPFEWVGDLLSWFGQWLAYGIEQLRVFFYNLVHPFNPITGTVERPGAFTSDAFTRALLTSTWQDIAELTLGTLSAAGEDYIENTGGYGGYQGGPSSTTTVEQAPDIYVYITVQGNVIGAGGLREVGETVARALEQYAGIGGRIHIEEAID